MIVFPCHLTRFHSSCGPVSVLLTLSLTGKKVDHVELLSEAFPESEFNINPTPNASDGQGLITVEDLIAPLQGTTGFGSLRKRMYQLDKKGSIVNAPLSKAVQERVDRKAGYEQTSEEVSKWQEIVKTNREAPTLVFTQRPELSATSTAELVSKFEPCTDLEKQVASLLQENGFATSALEQENELGFNKVRNCIHNTHLWFARRHGC